VFHNNVFGNGLRVSSVPIELSYNAEGNYWGRLCPGPHFVAGTDSNALDVLDTFPYGEQDGWLTGATPVRCDCIEPPSGVVAWWLGDGNAEDLVSGLNGTPVGGATFAPGQVRQAFLLDGVDDVVETPAAAALSFGFGRSAWKAGSGPRAWRALAASGGSPRASRRRATPGSGSASPTAR
jgi:hypothetical protein